MLGHPWVMWRRPWVVGRRGNEGLSLARIVTGANEECKSAEGAKRPVYNSKNTPFDLLLCAVLLATGHVCRQPSSHCMSVYLRDNYHHCRGIANHCDVGVLSTVLLINRKFFACRYQDKKNTTLIAPYVERKGVGIDCWRTHRSKRVSTWCLFSHHNFPDWRGRRLCTSLPSLHHSSTSFLSPSSSQPQSKRKK